MLSSTENLKSLFSPPCPIIIQDLRKADQERWPIFEESRESLNNRVSFLRNRLSFLKKHRKRFTQVFDLYPAINIYLLIDLYPAIGENKLASHPSDGFLHFLKFTAPNLSKFVQITRIHLFIN
jgi:hypothetical protein